MDLTVGCELAAGNRDEAPPIIEIREVYPAHYGLRIHGITIKLELFIAVNRNGEPLRYLHFKQIARGLHCGVSQALHTHPHHYGRVCHQVVLVASGLSSLHLDRELQGSVARAEFQELFSVEAVAPLREHVLALTDF